MASNNRRKSKNNHTNNSSKSAAGDNQRKVKDASTRRRKNGLGSRHKMSKDSSKDNRTNKSAYSDIRSNGMNAVSDKPRTKTTVFHASNSNSGFISSNRK